MSGETTHGKGVYGVLTLLVLLGVTIWFGALQWRGHLTVKSVVVEGQHILTADEVVKLAQVTLNTKMYDIDLTTIEKNVATNHFVRTVTVTRDAPATIRVSVEERTPIALLLIPGRNDLLCIDGEGYILPHVASQSIFDLPVISGIDSLFTPAIGQRSTQADLAEATGVLQAAEEVSTELFHTISEVRVRNGHDLVLYSADTGIPIIFGRGEAARKMVMLDGFWKKFVSEEGSQNIRYIDIRYEDQVIVSSVNADSKNTKKAS